MKTSLITLVKVLVLLTLVSCSAPGENSATQTIQAERGIHMATQMASNIQATMQIEKDQITATAQALASMLETARQMPLVLFDPFDDDSGLWETGEQVDDLGKSWWNITAGRYEWRVEAATGLVWWVSPDMESISDFYLSVTAQKLDGANTALFGLAFRIFDFKHYYVFQINEHQLYSVFAYDYEEGWIELIPWIESQAIYPDQPNHLEIVANGSQFIFFINRQFINQVSDERFSSGTTGLLTGLDNAGEQALWAFDDFELRAPITTTKTLITPTP